MKLYNTLSGEKEVFSTSDSKVRMYVCGVTPYAPSHIGHAMFSVVFDVVRRYLESKGYEVNHVQNFTDVDDKMIQAASELRISTSELAERNIQAYLEELAALNVLPAHSYPRATQEDPKDTGDDRGSGGPRLCLCRQRRRLLPCQAERGVRQAEPPEPGQYDRWGQGGGRPKQRRLDGLRFVEESEAWRAGLGQPLGTRQTRMAYRVQRHVPGLSRRDA